MGAHVRATAAVAEPQPAVIWAELHSGRRLGRRCRAGRRYCFFEKQARGKVAAIGVVRNGAWATPQRLIQLDGDRLWF